MAHYRHTEVLPKLAASNAIPAFRPVTDAGAVDRVGPVATNNVQILGFTIATGASAGNPLAVVTEGVVKALSVASIGAGQEVMVASSNGALGLAAAASGFTRWSAGITQDAAAAGDTFSVLLRQRQISGAI